MNCCNKLRHSQGRRELASHECRELDTFSIVVWSVGDPSIAAWLALLAVAGRATTLHYTTTWAELPGGRTTLLTLLSPLLHVATTTSIEANGLGPASIVSWLALLAVAGLATILHHTTTWAELPGGRTTSLCLLGLANLDGRDL